MGKIYKGLEEWVNEEDIFNKVFMLEVVTGDEDDNETTSMPIWFKEFVEFLPIKKIYAGYQFYDKDYKDKRDPVVHYEPFFDLMISYDPSFTA